MAEYSSSRFIAIACIVLILVAGPVAAAQTELEEAEQEAADSGAELSRAEAVKQSAEADYSSAEIALGAAIGEFQQTRVRYQEISGIVLGVAGEISDTETELAGLRSAVVGSAVDKYMTLSQPSGVESFFTSADALTSLMHAELITDLAETGIQQISHFTATKSYLEEQRVTLDAVQVQLGDLSNQLALQQQQMETLFDQAAVDLTASREAVAAADTAYRNSLTRVEEEETRLAALVGSGSWRPLVSEFFPAAHVEEALAIMQCESGGNPNAVNPTSGASGLFQFLESTWLWASPLAGYGGSSRFDPLANVATASWLFQYTVKNGHRNGIWAHWECRRVLY